MAKDAGTKNGAGPTGQAEVLAFLARPEAYGLPADEPVERVDTHISAVFLAGPRAYKLKRAVRYPYVDFSTLAARAEACRSELAVNRRTAPDLYLETVAVTREAGGALALGGRGQPVEHLVVMRRFDQAGLLDRLARQGALDLVVVGRAAEAIARFHASAAPTPTFGGAQAMRAVAADNARCFARYTAADMAIFAPDAVTRLVRRTEDELDRLALVLDERRAAGRVRHCHGDLHLRNIVLLEGEPWLFDAIEFSASLAHIDVFYDLAFLIMDLLHRGLGAHANAALNRYLDVTGDEGGLATLPLFLALRAAIRTHVGAAAAVALEGDARAAAAAEAQAYLAEALRFLDPAPPVLVAVGGLSGSGKSRAARALAPALGRPPGARIVRSDVLRKRLAGVDPLTRLAETDYGEAMTARTYGALGREVARALAAGQASVADAVFARAEQRHAVEAVALEAGVPFVGLWLEAPAEVMVARVEGRRGDASDATAAVVRRQLGYATGPMEWRRVETGGDKAESDARLLAATAEIRTPSGGRKASSEPPA